MATLDGVKNAVINPLAFVKPTAEITESSESVESLGLLSGDASDKAYGVSEHPFVRLALAAKTHSARRDEFAKYFDAHGVYAQVQDKAEPSKPSILSRIAHIFRRK